MTRLLCKQKRGPPEESRLKRHEPTAGPQVFFRFEIQSDDQARGKRGANRLGEINSGRLGRTMRHTDNHAVKPAVGGLNRKPNEFAVATFVERLLQAAAAPRSKD